MYNNNQGVHARPASSEPRGSHFGRLLAFVAAIAIIGAGGYAYYTMRGSGNSVDTGKIASSSSETVSTEELQGIVLRLQKLILTPSEQPVIYTVDNAKELTAQQAFFAGSQNGDVLLVFPKAQKAILYSPSRNIIVNVGPITYDDKSVDAASSMGTGTTTRTATEKTTPR